MATPALTSLRLIGLGGVLIGVAASAWAADSSWVAERERVREVRVRLRSQVQQDRMVRAQKNSHVIADLIHVAGERRVAGQDAILERMIAQVEELWHERAVALREQLDALPAEPTGDDRDDRWTRSLEEARQELVRRPAELLERSLSLGASDVAAELVTEILAFDPDYRPVRDLLGQTRFEGQWLGRYAFAQAQKGVVWDDRFGWKLSANAARYEQGEYYDAASKRWLRMAAANQAHSVLENPWRIQTEHLVLSGTVSLAELAQMASLLESYYSRILADYAKFFVKGDGGYRRFALGAGDHAPLAVAMYRNRDQYRKACPRSVAWSRGSFDSELRASSFYGIEPVLMYHEFAHQMFSIFAGGNQSPAWLSEGVAVYCESAREVGDQMVLGGIVPTGRVAKHLRQFALGEAMPIAEVVQLGKMSTWTATDAPQKQYEAAGAMVAFCMDAREGAFRADFIDFMRDSYRGATNGYALWDYLGYDRDSFFSVFESWALAQSREQAAGLSRQ